MNINKIIWLIKRLVDSIITTSSFKKCFFSLISYPSFWIDYIRYAYHSKEKVPFFDLYPKLGDKAPKTQTGGGHYFYQDIWALRKIYKSGTAIHHDVGSRIDGFVAQCSIFAKVVFVDFRPVNYGIEDLTSLYGNILELSFQSRSISSLSCLHVIEHIGLGRYGDPINPLGSIMAMKELQRILQVGGHIYVGIPIGRERVMYNAHRIFNPTTIIDVFDELVLVEFSAVDDRGNFIVNAQMNDFSNAFYSLGLFHFRRLR